MVEKNLVTISNYFTMNSLYEQKIILMLASMVQLEDEEFKIYKLKIKEFIKLLGLKDQSKYAEIPKIAKELMKQVFEIEEGNKIIQVSWFSSVAYEKGSGVIELEFSPRLKPYMLKLNTIFTKHKKDNILNMKSEYSSRIFELLKCNEFKKQGYIEIELDELKKITGANAKAYENYSDFKRKVILKVQKELVEKADINFNFEEIKTGRKITSIKFTIPSKKEITTTATATNSQDSLIKQVQTICYKYEISDDEANCMLIDSDNNINFIKGLYEYMINGNKKYNDVVGYMRSMIAAYTDK